MEEKNVLKRRIQYNAIVYALVFLAVIITPFIAEQAAKIFDFVELNWSEKGLLRGFFKELFTALLWVMEILVFRAVMKRIRKKNSAQKIEFLSEENEEEQLIKETAVASSETQSNKKGNRIKKEPAQLLPMKKVGILTGIVVICILLVTLRIGFNVKIAYDLGEKITREGLITKGGELIMISVKCVWIQIILKSSLQLCKDVCQWFSVEEKRMSWLQWLGAGVMLFVFGVYDALMTAGGYLFIYLFFYVAFTAIYYFTEKHSVKSYLLTLFIYLF